MLLNELDRRGRVRGAAVCELDEALEFLRELAEEDKSPATAGSDYLELPPEASEPRSTR